MTCLLNRVTALVVMNAKGVQIISITILDGSDLQLIHFKKMSTEIFTPSFSLVFKINGNI